MIYLNLAFIIFFCVFLNELCKNVLVLSNVLLVNSVFFCPNNNQNDQSQFSLPLKGVRNQQWLLLTLYVGFFFGHGIANISCSRFV